ncbi:hypothetical protein BRPE64_ACDS25990 [Caballeronia insecticola]|uniref:Uncharacterized protein n=1 Tax=Caballeronia insecticola TaxID=758793 RepID=R4WIX0_9BURK|nr:hypothetical protein BRPE64_ACDS25990 [Caballeronia insecticola]
MSDSARSTRSLLALLNSHYADCKRESRDDENATRDVLA